MAAGRRGRGDGVVVGLPAAMQRAVGLCAAPSRASPDLVAPQICRGTTAARRRVSAQAGDRSRSTPAPSEVAGGQQLRRSFVGDDSTGSAPALWSAAARPVGRRCSGAGCRVVLAGGCRPAAAFASDGEGASISLPPGPPSLLVLQIRFFPSSVVFLPVLSDGAAPAPLFLGASPFLG
ncbi:hypothetical protein OsI_12030 [Oryza sativa Indica Group]|uniref:Uncharacterized protein n=1 Tax=Oryza sativa subsp. indica TaxID=39946 RepID=A2XHY4_ORYSI|nr:hypothetical protein OsI_12030 [Oryza sativa Indica Group]